MSGARYSVHRLIQDMNRDQTLAGRFLADPQALFDLYGLTTRERELLRTGTAAALIELGVHPNLQMKFHRLKSAAAPPGPGPLEYYLRQLDGRD